MSIKEPCAYCGMPSDKRDREHVFPKNLYPKSKSKSKIQRLTIPACNKCNNSWSDDEVHFRNMLVLAGDPSTIVKKELWETTIKRSFSQIDGFKRLKDLSERMKQVNIDGQKRNMVYPGDDQRVVRIIRKIIRGLSYYHGLVTPIAEDNIFVDVLKFEIPEEILEEIECHHRDKDIVEYRYQVFDQLDFHSGWLITFFRTVTFVGVISMP